MYIPSDYIEARAIASVKERQQESVDSMAESLGLRPSAKEEKAEPILQMKKPEEPVVKAAKGEQGGTPDSQAGKIYSPTGGDMGNFISGILGTAPATVQEATNFLSSVSNMIQNPSVQVGQIPRIELIGKPETDYGKAGRMVGDMLLTGGVFGASKKIVPEGASALTKYAAQSGVTAFADAVLFDPNEERFSNFVAENVGFMRPMAEFLAHDQNSPEIVERFKNGLEGAVVGAVGDLSLHTLGKAYKFARNIRGGGPTRTVAPDAFVSSKIDVEIPANSKPLIPTTNEKALARYEEEKLEYAQLKEKHTDVTQTDAQIAKNNERIKELEATLSMQEEMMKQEASGKKTFNTLTEIERAAGEYAKVGEVGGYKNLKEMTDKLSETSHIDDVIGEAFKMASDPTQMAKLYVRKNGAFNAIETRAMLIDSKSQLVRLRKAARDLIDRADMYKSMGTNTLEDKKLSLISNLKDASMKYTLARRIAVGEQALSMRVMQEDMSSYGKAYAGKVAAEMEKFLGKSDELTEVTKAIAVMDEPALADFAQKSTRMNIVKAASEALKLSLVSGIETSFSNVVSGLGNVILRPIDLAAAKFSAAISRDTKSSSELGIRAAAALKEGASSSVRAMGGHLVGAFSALGQGFKLPVSAAKGTFRDDFVKFIDRYTVGANSRLNARKSFLRSTELGVDPNTPIGAMLDIGGAGIRSLGIGIAATDTYIDTVAMSMSRHENAYTLGIRKGLQGAELEQYVKNVKGANYEDSLSREGSKYYSQFDREVVALNREADKYAQEVKLIQDPHTSIGKWTVDILSKAGEEKLGFAPLDILMPFGKVAVNIAEGTYDRTLLSLLSSQTREILQAGGPEAHIIKGKILTGTALMTAGATLYANGQMIGSLMGSRQNEQQLREFGMQGNTVQFNGVQMPLNRFGSWGFAVSLGADISALGLYAAKTGIAEQNWFKQEYGKLMLAASAAIANNATPQELLETASELTGILADPQSAGKTEAGPVSSLVGTAMVPGVVKDLEKRIDPLRRSTMVKDDGSFKTVQYIWNTIVSRMPYLSKSLPPVSDILGNDIKEVNGTLHSTLDLALGETGKASMAAEELVSLGFYGPMSSPSKHDQPHLLLRKPTDVVSKTVAGVFKGSYALTPEQYYYYTKLVAGKDYKVVKDGGKKSLKFSDKKGSLERFIESDLRGKSRIEKLFAVKKFHESQKKAALATMFMEFPEISTQIYKEIGGQFDSFDERENRWQYQIQQ